MSDETVTLKRRIVARNPVDRLYYIYEFLGNLPAFIDGERGYRHSTSAYARLGRITSEESK